MTHARRLLATLVAAGLVAGCGGGDPPSDEDQIRAVTNDYLIASADADGEAGCATLDDYAQTKYMQINPDCAKGFAQLAKSIHDEADFDSVEIERVTIRGAEATVGFQDDPSTITLQKQDDGSWLIDKQF